MTQDYEQAGRPDVPRRSSGAPWPLVERRAAARPFDAGSPLLRLPRQPSGPLEGASSPGPAGEHVRRVLPVAAAPPARARVPVLLGDLLGVVLVVTAGTSSAAAVTVALAWCLALVLAEVAAPPGWPAGPRQVLVSGGGLVLAAALVAYAAELDLPRALVLGALPLAVGLSATGRAVRPAGTAELSRVVLVGTPESVVAARALLVRGGSDVSVVGICCPLMAGAPASIGGVPVVGDLDELAPTVWRGGVDLIVVCSAAETSGPVLRRIVWDLEGSGVPVLVAPGIVELGPDRVRLTTLAGMPLLRISEPGHTGAARRLKHGGDRLAAALGLVALLPLLLAVAAAVRWTTPGPALFRQVRVGQDGRAFTLVKFRSMHVDAEEGLPRVREQNRHAHGPLFKAERDPRVTPLGRVLRRSSLDELPQLLNVVRGEMSLVGPRPPLPSEVCTYSDAVPRRLKVRPGLTGLWQVSGRADLGWDESARLDLWYVENWSLRLDLSILGRTVGAVVRGRGAY